MISREEAKQKLFHFMASELSMKNYTFEATIDEIFDSVGTCGECKFFKMESSTCAIINQVRETAFFCGDFKRKSDDK